MPPSADDMRKYLIFFIIASGLALRLLRLPDFPPSLNWDEVSLGYNAYSLLLTGRDEWGALFPTILRAFGDYKLPIYAYAAVLPIKLFGLTELAVRLPSALAGSLAIFAAYVLAFRLFGRRSVAVLSALMVALEPWTLFLSRLALEANFAQLLITLGLVLLVSRRYLLSALFFGLSIWTYNSARIFIPLLLISYYLYYRKYLKFSYSALLTLAVFILPMFWQLFTAGGQARFRGLNILDSGTVARIEHNRNVSALPSPLTRLIHNRPVYFVWLTAGNYLKYFSPNFLFFSGGDHYQFSVQGHGLLYLINLPFFYLGLYLLVSKPHPAAPLILLWLLLAPIPGSLVRDAPHTLRSITFLPAPMLISAYGLAQAAARRRLLLPLYLLLLVMSFTLYARRLIEYLPAYSWAFQYGHKQLIQYIKQVYDNYDVILITKRWAEPHEFLLFYWPWNPQFYRSDPTLVRYGRDNWFWVDSFAKFRFINDWEMEAAVAAAEPGKKYLIVASPDADPPAVDLARINFLNGLPAFLIKAK